MEGLIILAILALIFRNVFSKQGFSWKKFVKEFADEGTPQRMQSSSGNAAQTTAKPKSPPKPSQRRATPDSDNQMSKEFVRAEAYVPLRSRLDDVRARSGDGSMDPYSLEGTASSEGSATKERLDTLPPTRDKDRIALEPLEEPQIEGAYAHTILPKQFGGDAILQAVVMHEILSRTRKRGG